MSVSVSLALPLFAQAGQNQDPRHRQRQAATEGRRTSRLRRRGRTAGLRGDPLDPVVQRRPDTPRDAVVMKLNGEARKLFSAIRRFEQKFMEPQMFQPLVWMPPEQFDEKFIKREDAASGRRWVRRSEISGSK